MNFSPLCFQKPLLLAVALVAALPGGASAQDSSSPRGDTKVSLSLGIPESLDFHGYIGIAAGVLPEYEGGDETAMRALPMLDVRLQDFLFMRGTSTNPNDGYASLGWHALNFGYDKRSTRKVSLSTGPLARVSRGRDEGDSDALRGLGEIDHSLGLGGFLEARVGRCWSADIAAVSQDAGEAGDGLLVSIRSGYTAQVNERLAVTFGIFTSWADDDYMQGYYGVSSGQAASSGLSSFAAGSGFKDVGISLRADHTLATNILVSGEVGYQRLLGDAGNSPIVDDKGSRDQFRAMFGVAYKF